MGANSKPWTDAITSLLADGEWHATEEVLAAGAAMVSSDRALQEMGSKQAGQSEERRVQIGKRNVAMQSITGMERFGKAEFGPGKKQVRKCNDGKPASTGENARKIKDLETTVADLQLRLEALESYRDTQESKELDNPGRQFLAAAGVQVDA